MFITHSKKDEHVIHEKDETIAPKPMIETAVSYHVILSFTQNDHNHIYENEN
jgi:hypothetical protein